MKNFVIMIVALLLGFNQTNAQNQQEIVYGGVSYDGFQSVTKGAFWKTRPEAKMVYEGSYPPGVEVYTLESDYYVKFAGNEHNNLDRNYIIFPKGQKVYTKNGNYYAAYCGNQIEYLHPVDQVKVVPATPRDSVVVRYKDSTVVHIKDSIVEKPAIVPQHLPNLTTGLPKVPKNSDDEEKDDQSEPKKKKDGLKLTIVAVFNGSGGLRRQGGMYQQGPMPRFPNDGDGNGGGGGRRRPNDGDGHY